MGIAIPPISHRGHGRLLLHATMCILACPRAPFYQVDAHDF